MTDEKKNIFDKIVDSLTDRDEKEAAAKTGSAEARRMNVERWSLLGSAWKRKAAVLAGDDPRHLGFRQPARVDAHAGQAGGQVLRQVTEALVVRLLIRRIARPAIDMVDLRAARMRAVKDQDDRERPGACRVA